jgi:hypothetical protein
LKENRMVYNTTSPRGRPLDAGKPAATGKPTLRGRELALTRGRGKKIGLKRITAAPARSLPTQASSVAVSKMPLLIPPPVPLASQKVPPLAPPVREKPARRAR